MWPPKHIALAGIELEGGWTSRPRGLKGDGSVRVAAPVIGEVSPPPAKPTAVPAIIKRYYPEYANQTCGFHIHISTKRADEYTTLMTGEYNLYFLEKMDRWGHEQTEDMREFFRRLEGRNTYCKKNYKPLDQCDAIGSNPDRYCQLNFCYARHGTLECRLFPMFLNSDTAVSAYKRFITITDDFIIGNIKKEQAPIEIVDDTSLVEEVIQL